MATPVANWLGNQQNQAWAGDAVRDCQRLPTRYPTPTTDCAGDNGRKLLDGLRDAGFVYLVIGTTTYRDAVRDWLLAQITLAGTDFANATRWPTTYVNQDKDFHISLWLRKAAYAYSYIRSSLTAQQQTDIDAWFVKAATWLDTMNHNAAKNRYPNRLLDDYTVVGNCGGIASIMAPITHLGSTNEPRTFGFAWDNKGVQHNAAVAAVGVITGNTTLIASAKRHVKEWLRANVYADGTVWDQARWGTGVPLSGWNYAFSVIGSVITSVDHVARTGDTELYSYSTTAGDCGNSAGGPKSLLKVLQRYANIALGNTTIYASTTATTDPNKRIFHYGERVDDIMFGMANIFYQDNLLLQSYTRALPATPNYGGYDPWGGDWGNLPAVRFMFGQQEGVVNPYTGASDDVGQALFGHWTGDNVATDSSGIPAPDNDCTNTGVTFDPTNKKVGTHAFVLGNASILTCGTRGLPSSVTPFTVTMWVRPTEFPGTEYLLGHTSCGPSYCNRIQLYTDDIGGLLDLGLGSSHTTATAIANLAVNTWYFIALRRIADTYQVFLLQDGAANATGWLINEGSITGLTAKAGTFAIGNNHANNTQGFEGQIDDVKFWNTARTDQEILDIYNANNAGSDLTLPGAPTEIALTFVGASGEMGATGNTVAIMTLANLSAGQAYVDECSFNHFELEVGSGNFVPVTSCSWPNGTKCGAACKMRVTVATAPANNTVVVDFHYKRGMAGAQEVTALTNTVSTPVAPLTDLEQPATWRAGWPLRPGLWRSQAGVAIQAPSPTPLLPIYVAVVNNHNTADSAVASYEPWCTVGAYGNGSTAIRVTGVFSTLPIRFTPVGDLITFPVNAATDGDELTLPGGITAQMGGTVRGSTTASVQTSLGPDKAIVDVLRLQIDGGLSAGDTFECCMREQGNATALGACAPIQIAITRAVGSF